MTTAEHSLQAHRLLGRETEGMEDRAHLELRHEYLASSFKLDF